jgi:serine/threonine-protein kinase
MSPDGQHIAYVGGPDDLIYIRDIDRFDARPLPGTEGADVPAFSPDGQWIAFQANDKIKKVALAGGTPIALADNAEGRGIGWESNDSILFNPGRATGVWRVSAGGGAPQQVTKVHAGENSQSEAEGLPGGRAILYRANGSNALAIYAESLTTGERHLIDRGANPHYLRSGHIAFVQDGTLLAVPFDLDRLERTGRQTVVITGVRQTDIGGGQFAFSQTGSLAYLPAIGEAQRDTLVWVDSTGAEQLTTMTGEAFRGPRLSPDLQRVAVRIGTPSAAQGSGGDLWIYELATNRRNRLSFDGASTFPLWDPAGGRLVLSSRQKDGSSQVLMKTLDGTARDRLIVTPRGTNYPLSWSPDGRFVATVSVDPDTSSDIWALTLEPSPTWQLLVRTTYREGAPTFSPDSRLIAYASDTTGRSEIYVRPFPSGSEVAVSTQGGTEPLFARGTPTLFYRHGDEMLAVDITAGPPITVGTPRVLFKRRYNGSEGVWPNYDVTPDGRRLLMIRRTTQEAPSLINVILNSLGDFTRAAPAK